MFNRTLLTAKRDAQGLTQRGLAEASGVPYGTIACIESGHVKEPSAKTIKRLAESLNTPWPLFFESDDLCAKQEDKDPNGAPTNPAA